MKFLVVGLGSMGKRRVRCLQALGYKDIIGFDPREDRRQEARSLYGIEVVSEFTNAIVAESDAMIVSTPPDRHTEYACRAVDAGKPAFIEASVVLEEVLTLEKYNNDRVFLAPSCTMLFHPMLSEIIAIVKSGVYGKVANFTYHSGQYLPDWHPWEDIRDFYVSNPLTGAAREIVPFELTWIAAAFGLPIRAMGLHGQTIDMGIALDDAYGFVALFPGNVIGTVAVDVVSRFATRSLVLNFEKAQIRWNWEDAYYAVYEAEKKRTIRYGQPEFEAQQGYNKNIGEQMYINEIAAFIKGIGDHTQFPNSIGGDRHVLEILHTIETTAR